MRTKIEHLRSSVAYPYTDKETPKEVIMNKLKRRYDVLPYKMGKVVEILDIVPDKYGEVTQFIGGVEFIVKFTAKVRIIYFNQGDVLFGVSIETPKGLNVGIYDVVNVETPYNAIIRLDKHIPKANVIITGITDGTHPQYMTELALYPKYSMISIGTSKGENVDLEPKLYPTSKPPSKIAHPECVDPLYNVPNAKRHAIVISSIRRFYSIIEEPIVYELNKRAKEVKDKVHIELVVLDKAKELIELRQEDDMRSELVYSPAMHQKMCAVVTFPRIIKPPYDSKAIDNFILKVEDYLAMKQQELLHTGNISPALLDLYKKKREEILKLYVV